MVAYPFRAYKLIAVKELAVHEVDDVGDLHLIEVAGIHGLVVIDSINQYRAV